MEKERNTNVEVWEDLFQQYLALTPAQQSVVLPHFHGAIKSELHWSDEFGCADLFNSLQDAIDYAERKK